ncbi:MAG: hypothetical protein Kow0029_05110 [Candidatus Rifleibacteriota bacterium]
MKNKRFFVFLMLVLSLGISFNASASNDYMNYIDNSSLDIGSGFDFINRTVKRSAIVPFKPVYVSDGGQDVEYTLEYVESSDDFSNYMEIDADGSIDGIVNSASARTKFLSESEANSYSMNFVVRVKVINGTKRIPTANYFLNKEAKELLANDKDPLKVRFHQAYGDRYVSAITTGGEYIGLINIETSSIQDKKQLEAELNASGLSWNAHAEFKGQMEKISKTRKVTVKNYIRGGHGIQGASDVDKMMEIASNFPKAVFNAGVPLKVELSPYTDFVEYTGSSESLSDETRFALQDLNHIYVDYMFFKNNLVHIKNNTSNYDWSGTSVGNIERYIDQTQSKMREMQTLAANLIKGSVKPSNPVFMALKDFSRNMKLPLQKIIIHPAKFDLYPFKKHTCGDTEMAGHKPVMTISGKVYAQDKGKKLYVKVNGKVRESKRDWTTFEDSADVKIFDRDVSAPGYVVVKFSPKEGELSYTFGKDDHSWRTAKSAKGLIRSFSGLGDTKGKDSGRLGARQIELAPIEIVIDLDQKLYGHVNPNIANIKNFKPHLSATHAMLKAKHRAVNPIMSWFKGKQTAPAHINKTKGR